MTLNPTLRTLLQYAALAFAIGFVMGGLVAMVLWVTTPEVR